MTFSTILDQVSAGDIDENTAADLLESIGIDPVDVAGEIADAAQYSEY